MNEAQEDIVVVIILLLISGPCDSGNNFLRGSASVQGEESDSIKGRWTHTFACGEVNGLLYVWVGRRHNWWITRSWWRLHLGATFHWPRNSSSGTFLSSLLMLLHLEFTLIHHQLSTQLGLQCYLHFCHDVFCIHVCGGVLPSQTFSCSLW